MLCSLWFSVRCACAIKPPNNDPCDVYLQVKTKLENKLQEKNITLDVCTDKDLKAKPKVTLVFCILSSRIGTDIQHALEGVDKGMNVFYCFALGVRTSMYIDVLIQLTIKFYSTKNNYVNVN